MSMEDAYAQIFVHDRNIICQQVENIGVEVVTFFGGEGGGLRKKYSSFWKHSEEKISHLGLRFFSLMSHWV